MAAGENVSADLLDGLGLAIARTLKVRRTSYVQAQRETRTLNSGYVFVTWEQS